MEAEAQGPPQPAKVADAPFNDPSGDIILRSDGENATDFYTYRFFLAHASPVFKDMFSLPQGDQTKLDNGPPVITMCENAEDLRALLVWCSPGMEPIAPASALQLYRQYGLADKYLLENMKMFLRKSLPNFVRQTPVGVYMISRQLGWKQEAREAIGEALSRPLTDLLNETNTMPQDAPAQFLRDLLQYHDERSRILSCYMSVDHWMAEWYRNGGSAQYDDSLEPFIRNEDERIGCCDKRQEPDDPDAGDLYTMVWWEEFLSGCSASLARIPDFEKVPLAELLCKASANTVKCRTCGPTALEELNKFFIVAKRHSTDPHGLADRPREKCIRACGIYDPQYPTMPDNSDRIHHPFLPPLS